MKKWEIIGRKWNSSKTWQRITYLPIDWVEWKKKPFYRKDEFTGLGIIKFPEGETFKVEVEGWFNKWDNSGEWWIVPLKKKRRFFKLLEKHSVEEIVETLTSRDLIREFIISGEKTS
jgi:hypothetical protein